MMDPEEQFSAHVRLAKPDDRAYVASSWLKAILHNTPWLKGVEAKTYFQHFRPVVSAILDRSAVLVAHPANDADTILGFLVAEVVEDRPTIHWIYVRSTWRRIGIARQLVTASGIDLNQATYSLRSFDSVPLVRRYPGLQFNPFLALR